MDEVQKDISIISLKGASVKWDKAEGDREKPASSPAGKAGPRGPARYKSRLAKFLASWTSTVPDAVGVTGIKYIVSSNYHQLRRLVWVIAVVGGIGAACNQIINRAVFFIGNPKSVDVQVKYDKAMTFPAVTLCNLNNYMNVKGRLESQPFGQLLHAHSGFENVYSTHNFTHVEADLRGVNTTALYLEYAHHMDHNGGMFVWGVWDGSEPLGAVNFTRVITDFGVCYTFNAGRNGDALLKQRAAGRTHGLMVMLNVQEEYYYYSHIILQLSSGFLVSVHDPNDVSAVNSRGVGVEPGTECRIGVRAKKTTNLPPPSGECGSRELKYFSDYTVNKCQRDCLTDLLLGACGCVEPYMAVVDDIRVCDPIEVIECIYWQKELLKSTLNECNCPVPCSTTTYATSLSYTRFPSTFYARQMDEFLGSLGTHSGNGSDSHNLVVIEVFFEELAVDQFTQQTDYTFFAFLCDIGGALGLWLGGSILTIMEIIDHFTYTTFIHGLSSDQYSAKTGLN